MVQYKQPCHLTLFPTLDIWVSRWWNGQPCRRVTAGTQVIWAMLSLVSNFFLLRNSFRPAIEIVGHLAVWATLYEMILLSVRCTGNIPSNGGSICRNGLEQTLKTKVSSICRFSHSLCACFCHMEIIPLIQPLILWSPRTSWLRRK